MSSFHQGVMHRKGRVLQFEKCFLTIHRVVILQRKSVFGTAKGKYGTDSLFK